MSGPSIALFGSYDKSLEALLKSSGGRVANQSLEDLGALAHATAAQPDLVVIDLRARAELPPALALLKRHHPHTGVIIVASQLDPALMLEAMRAGVNEWVTDPVEPADLEAALARVVAHRVGPTIGQIFAFLGAKGGVGTTTLAVNVATSLAKMGGAGSTLLLDLHLAHGDAAVFLGVEPRFSVVDALDNTHRLDESFLKSLVVRTKAGPDLLGSSDHAVPSIDSKRVHALLEFVASHYQYVVIDCPRSDMACLDALERAARITVVANQELATVRSGSRIAATLRQRYGQSKVSVVVSRYDASSDIGRDDVERVVGGSVKHVFPSDYRLSVASLNKGRPLVLENHSKLASSFTEFARDLAGVKDAPAGKKSPGLFGRWSKG